MKNSEWNNLRTKIHHDWIQNKYLTFLTARSEYLDSIAGGPGEAAEEDVLNQFLEFQNRKEGIETFLEEAVAALSPAQLLEEFPLKGMKPDQKEWLGPVVHALYLARTGIEERIDRVRENFYLLEETHRLLAEILKGSDGELMGKTGERPFMAYLAQVREFSAMISSLPHGIQIA